jgi:hypothetical protein
LEFWRPTETHCVNLATSSFFSSQNVANFFFKFPNFPLLDSPAHFLSPSGENSPQKKTLIWLVRNNKKNYFYFLLTENQFFFNDSIALM